MWNYLIFNAHNMYRSRLHYKRWTLVIISFWWVEVKRQRDTKLAICCTYPFEYRRVQVPRLDTIRRIFEFHTGWGISAPLGLQTNQKHIDGNYNDIAEELCEMIERTIFPNNVLWYNRIIIIYRFHQNINNCNNISVCNFIFI